MYNGRRWILAAGFVVLTLGSTPAWPEALRLGRPVSSEEASRWHLNVFPDGEGLPAGRGNARQGRSLYASKCASCHGVDAQGGSAGELAGGTHPLTSSTPDKTIGLYWPFATTIFDVTRRSMPMDAPGSLTNDEVYALTAYLLFANHLIGEDDDINSKTLPAIQMPNRNGFIWIDADPTPNKSSSRVKLGH